MDVDQVLRVGIWLEGSFAGMQYFYTKNDQRRRILIPLLTLVLISREEKPTLEGHIFEITFEPT
ncbi:MAG: hypothetical protein ABSD42_02955 [Candidatus Bathyarchaeia archaeon]